MFYFIFKIEREKEREREGETDRQRHRDRERQRQRQIGTETEISTIKERPTEKQTIKGRTMKKGNKLRHHQNNKQNQINTQGS